MPRQLQMSLLMPLDKAVDEAIEFIREHEPPEGYYVGFSGGKDSICLLELVRMSGVKHEAYYSATGIDPPEIVKFIKREYPEVRILTPKESFWEGIRKRSPPLRYQRWCCETLKHEPGSHIPLKHRLMGIRAEESRKRAESGQITYFKREKQIHYHPIFYWTFYHVWTFIEENGLPYPSLYDGGWERVGCVICPFILHKNTKRIDMARTRWPQYFRLFERVCKQWWDSKPRNDVKHKTFDSWLEAYYRGFE